MNHITALVALVALTACTQAATPPTETLGTDGKTQLAGTPAAVQAVAAVATTPVLSLLIGSSVNSSAKGNWCVKDGTPPFTKISIQDSSIAAPIENQSAPLGTKAVKDTATQQAPGTATITSQTSDSVLKIQWLREGIKGDAQLTLQGDTLSFVDDAGTSTFSRCQ